MSASKIPSPSGGRKSTLTPKDAIPANSTPYSYSGTNVPMPPGVSTMVDVKTIRGGGVVPDSVSPRVSSSALPNMTNGSETLIARASFSGTGMPKVKANRSLSSGVLGGLRQQQQQSSAIEHSVAGGEPVPMLMDPVSFKQGSSQMSSSSGRSQNSSSYHLGSSDSSKMSSTSGLRTPTAVKEMRTSPSKSHSKSAVMNSNPINVYATNQPMPLYGQGQAAAPAAAAPAQQSLYPGMESKSFVASSAVSPYPPLSPFAAMKLYAPYLSQYEKAEISDYPQVYYVGQNCRHKQAASLESGNTNFGFDDERGDYLIINHDHLMFRYEILDMLGKGSFGQVAKCYDHKTGEYVAIKIIRNKKRFHCQALVEVKILDNLNKWDPDDKHNLIRMTDNFYFRNHLCIATELLSINLYEFIKSNSFQGVSLGLIKRFCTQLLQSLELLNRHNVVHCDLKPENVLLKQPTKSSIKVIDFGSSCFENEKVYTYIQSRFYRSPEVILGMSYNMAIDMWSLGCILAELYTGCPLFPGENEQEQLTCIMETQGVPERYLIEMSSRRKVFFDSNGNPKLVVNSKGKKRRPGSKTLGQILKCTDVPFLDFIARCLIWDPEKRMTPREGLQHEWISDVRSASSSMAAATYSSPSGTESHGSRRKNSIHSSHSRRTKKDAEMSSGKSSLKSSSSSRAHSNSNGHGAYTFYGAGGGGGSMTSFSGSGGHTSNLGNIAKIYGGQQQLFLQQQQQHQQHQQQQEQQEQQQQHQQQQYQYQQQQQQQQQHQQQHQQMQQGYGSVYGASIGSSLSLSASSSSTLSLPSTAQLSTGTASSVSSRRLTLGGDLGGGPPSYYPHGSRKNAT
ncbi:hypothetical protein BGZ99_001981, partial [Dissophora globulifera]